MNKRIEELTAECFDCTTDARGRVEYSADSYGIEKFAELLMQECINTLEFHGFDEAISYMKWMSTNRFGVRYGN
jgi:hypothetical protein